MRDRSSENWFYVPLPAWWTRLWDRRQERRNQEPLDPMTGTLVRALVLHDDAARLDLEAWMLVEQDHWRDDR